MNIPFNNSKTILSKDKKVIFSADTFGRFNHFELKGHYASIVCPVKDKSYTIEFTDVHPIKVSINGKEVEAKNTVQIIANSKVKIEIWF